MRYIKRFSVLISTLVLMLSAMVVDTTAQRRGRVVIRRPVIVRSHLWRDPFWSSRSLWYDPFYDPYSYDPYLREQRDRYYKEKAVKDASKKLTKDKAKYASDGVLTDKEREKLVKRNRDYNKAIQKLDDFNRDSD